MVRRLARYGGIGLLVANPAYLGYVAARLSISWWNSSCLPGPILSFSSCSNPGGIPGIPGTPYLIVEVEDQEEYGVKYGIVCTGGRAGLSVSQLSEGESQERTLFCPQTAR